MIPLSTKRTETDSIINDGHISDLLYVLCTKQDSFTRSRIDTVITWTTNLYAQYQNDPTKYSCESVTNCIRCISSILWEVNSQGLISDLPSMITDVFFDMLFTWSQSIESALKRAIDTVICSICYIRPEMFNLLLHKMGVLVLNACAEPNQYETVDLTDLRLTAAQLDTIAIACQSPSAAKLLIDSELLGLLTFAVLEFTQCELSKTHLAYRSSSSSSSDTVKFPMMEIVNIVNVLNMFSTICYDGSLKDFVGLPENSKFWEPLLNLLCNGKMFTTNGGYDPTPRSYLNLENATIRFMSRATLCHPKNQITFTVAFSNVIREVDCKVKDNVRKKSIMSAFSQTLVLQSLLKRQRILVSVHSKLPLQNRAKEVFFNHPNKIANPYHLLFYIDIATKSSDILEHCVSKYDNAKEKAHFKDYNNVALGLYVELLRATKGEMSMKGKSMKTEFDHGFRETFAITSEHQWLISNTAENGKLCHKTHPDLIISSDSTLAQLLQALKTKKANIAAPWIHLTLMQTQVSFPETQNTLLFISNYEKLPTPLEVFSNHGALTMLSRHLPSLEVEEPPTISSFAKRKKENEECIELATASVKDKLKVVTSVPQQSLAAFALFLKLPAYAEFLMNYVVEAQCMLRLILGISVDDSGTEIYALPIASTLESFPFEIFRDMLENKERRLSESVVVLRCSVFEVGAIHLILNCLGTFSHNPRLLVPGVHELQSNVKAAAGSSKKETKEADERYFWPKGTGYGSDKIDKIFSGKSKIEGKQKYEDNQVTVLLQILARYITPIDQIGKNTMEEPPIEVPPIFPFLIEQSCLCYLICSYLRNDSILDIKMRIPLYRSILQLLRSISLSRPLMSLLSMTSGGGNNFTVATAMQDLKVCIDAYLSRLKTTPQENGKFTFGGDRKKDESDEEALTLFITEFQSTFVLVQHAISSDNVPENPNTFKFVLDSQKSEPKARLTEEEKPVPKNETEDLYVAVMKKFRFESYDMITSDGSDKTKFVVSYHFRKNIPGSAYTGRPARMRRLAQETVTLTSSLPISFNSSVFVRCDTDRLDVMKVLITGPVETPYAGGCFEFDVYFPSDYPNSPMQVNLATTGAGSVRFNPNLYNCGRVCLSILNTWAGGQDERWNPQSSTFLQVLVSIQSLILVPDPYFNEPGHEISLNTPGGIQRSKEYNSNIRQATVRWAMLEQIRNPNACFKEVIHAHFWLKKSAICQQIEGWISEMEGWSGPNMKRNLTSLRNHYAQLRNELAKLEEPPIIEKIRNSIANEPSTSSSIASPVLNNQSIAAAPTSIECIASTSKVGKSDADIFADMEDEIQEELNKFYAMDDDDHEEDLEYSETSSDEN